MRGVRAAATRRMVLVFAGLVLAATSAVAQPFTVPRFDFSFSSPGARSMGFAGAFAALADDATAAFGNPAGLVQLTKTEVSAELRLWDRSPTFLTGDRTVDDPPGVGVGVSPGPDFARGSSTLGLSYAAVVIPKGRWSFAVYGNQIARFTQTAELRGSVFDDSSPVGAAGWLFGTREQVDLEVKTLGAAAGWRVNEKLSVGLGVVYGEARLRTESETYLSDDDSMDVVLGPISFLPDRLLSTITMDQEGTDWTFNAGLLWRPSPLISVGVYHRQGTSVDGDIATVTGPAVPFVFQAQSPAGFDVPDVTGLGLAYRAAGGRLTVATEVDRVGYGGLIRVVDADALGLEARPFKDAWEVHLGAEYALVKRAPIVAFRVGTWVEADEGDGRLRDRSFVHWVAGLGIVARGFQIDLAIDLAKEVDTASLSFIYTF